MEAQQDAFDGTGIIWPSGFRERFVFGEQLGKGSFGTVSVAFDRKTARERAVKVIPKQRKNVPATKLAEKIRLEVGDAARCCLHADQALPAHDQLLCLFASPMW